MNLAGIIPPVTLPLSFFCESLMTLCFVNILNTYILDIKIVFLGPDPNPDPKDPKIVLYSPEELGLGKSGKAEGFPFR